MNIKELEFITLEELELIREDLLKEVLGNGIDVTEDFKEELVDVEKVVVKRFLDKQTRNKEKFNKFLAKLELEDVDFLK